MATPLPAPAETGIHTIAAIIAASATASILVIVFIICHTLLTIGYIPLHHSAKLTFFLKFTLLNTRLT